jgi:hypothetical protein
MKTARDACELQPNALSLKFSEGRKRGSSERPAKT